ncbi:MAG TPA: thiamine pyrophosphate-dependent enzyme, partial [Phycisphaerales bacterium]|nr:thiamine pyrophosphate-dependent enzyme [Phycisphaerales bacterium]
LERARHGGGVTLIEAVTYRLADHTTADDARRYRDEAEVASWRAKDPIIRTRKYLESKGLWNDTRQVELEDRAKTIVAEVVRTAETIPKPSTDDIFDYTYATLDPELERQKRTMRTSSLGQDPSQIGLSDGHHQRA